MIYDNAACVREAERIVEHFSGKSRVALVKEIAGELNRYYSLGKYAAIVEMKKALEKVEKKVP